MEMKKVRWQSPEEMKKMLTAFAGVLIYALGLNLFLVPAGLYSGGVMGFCQVLRTLLVNYLHLPLGGFDFAGIIYYLFNIPLFIMAFRISGASRFGTMWAITNGFSRSCFVYPCASPSADLRHLM